MGDEAADGLDCDGGKSRRVLRDDLSVQLARIGGSWMVWDFTFELSEVVAARSRAALSSKLIGTEISVRYSTAFAEALKNDSAMMVGWMPLLSIFSAAPNRLPANTTTEVVPSPASTSCAADKSTSYRKYTPPLTSGGVGIDYCHTYHFGSGMKRLDAP